ncbi:MAG: hypothetical protein WBR30_01680, partial [Candidatus Sulfotelmatobacter sp.]
MAQSISPRKEAPIPWDQPFYPNFCRIATGFQRPSKDRCACPPDDERAALLLEHGHLPLVF